MDYRGLIDTHRDSGADITIAAQPVEPSIAPAMGIFLFDRGGRIVGFEEKPQPPRLAEIGQSVPSGSTFAKAVEGRPFMASMGIYVFSRRVLLEMLEREAGVDFGRELIPSALTRYEVKPFVFAGYWVDVGTVESFYDANIMLGRADAPFSFWDARKPIYTHLRQLPGSRLTDCVVRQTVVADGCFIDGSRIEDSVVGVRARIQSGARITRSVLLGADTYEDGPSPEGHPPIGIGRDVVLERTIVDKNARIGDGARLTNGRGVAHADGEGYYIRGGIIVVPKGGVIPPGTVV
jgi:glucose-1-phosphate adenylyltransferase